MLLEHEAVAEARRRARPRPDAPRGAEGVRRARGRASSRARTTAKAIFELLPRAPRALQAGPPAGVRRPAQDDLGQDPPRRAARRRATRRARRRHRVPRRGLPGPKSYPTPAAHGLRHRRTEPPRIASDAPKATLGRSGAASRRSSLDLASIFGRACRVVRTAAARSTRRARPAGPSREPPRPGSAREVVLQELRRRGAVHLGGWATTVVLVPPVPVTSPHGTPGRDPAGAAAAGTASGTDGAGGAGRAHHRSRPVRRSRRRAAGVGECLHGPFRSGRNGGGLHSGAARRGRTPSARPWCRWCRPARQAARRCQPAVDGLVHRVVRAGALAPGDLAVEVADQLRRRGAADAGGAAVESRTASARWRRSPVPHEPGDGRRRPGRLRHRSWDAEPLSVAGGGEGDARGRRSAARLKARRDVVGGGAWAASSPEQAARAPARRRQAASSSLRPRGGRVGHRDPSSPAGWPGHSGPPGPEPPRPARPRVCRRLLQPGGGPVRWLLSPSHSGRLTNPFTLRNLCAVIQESIGLIPAAPVGTPGPASRRSWWEAEALPRPRHPSPGP